MPRSCSVCVHPRRAEIEAAIVAGETFRHMAARFGTSTGSLQRHRAGCVPGTLAKATEAADVMRGDGLLAQVCEQSARAGRLYAAAERVLLRAQRQQDHDTALEAIRTAAATMREARGILELLTKMHLASSEVLSRDEAFMLLEQVVAVVRHHVRDRETLAAISAEIAGLIRRHPTEVI
ncbi:MAG: hypothetical protein HY825_13670 [Acidobacteria bacterium]|nr:hypothetical protein [Acidobacteriota bacterium]